MTESSTNHNQLWVNTTLNVLRPYESDNDFTAHMDRGASDISGNSALALSSIKNCVRHNNSFRGCFLLLEISLGYFFSSFVNVVAPVIRDHFRSFTT